MTSTDVDEKESPAEQVDRRLRLIADCEGLIARHADRFELSEERRLRLVLEEARRAVQAINLRTVDEDPSKAPKAVQMLFRKSKAWEWLARAFVDARLAG